MLCESHHELAHVYEKSGDYGAFRRKGTLVRATEAMITDVRAGLVPVPVGRPASRTTPRGRYRPGRRSGPSVRVAPPGQDGAARPSAVPQRASGIGRSNKRLEARG